jgi:hypothetical protein
MSTQKVHLVAHYFQKPKDGVNTSKKGWMSDPANIRWDEKVEVVRNLRARDRSAQVVLDLVNKKVLANSFTGEKDFDLLFEYYFLNYNKYITPVMAQIDSDYVYALIDRLEGAVNDAENKVKDAVILDEKVQAE